MTRTATRRLLAWLLLPLVLAVSGCGRFNSDIVIKDETNVRASFNLGIEKAAAEKNKVKTDTMCNGVRPGQNGFPMGTTVEKYDDGTYVGCKVAFVGTVEQLGTSILDHTDHKWNFHLRPDSRQLSQLPPQIKVTDLTDFRVAVTFPGKVVKHNGSSTVQGNTVTWTNPEDFVSAEGLVASSAEALNTVLIAGIVTMAVLGAVVIVLALLLWRRGRNREASVQQWVDHAWAHEQNTQAHAQQTGNFYANPSQYPSGYVPPAGPSPWERPALPQPSLIERITASQPVVAPAPQEPSGAVPGGANIGTAGEAATPPPTGSTRTWPPAPDAGYGPAGRPAVETEADTATVVRDPEAQRRRASWQGTSAPAPDSAPTAE